MIAAASCCSQSGCWRAHVHEQIRNRREKALNALRARLVQGLEERGPALTRDGQGREHWVRVDAVRAWHSPAKFAVLARMWSKSPPAELTEVARDLEKARC